MGSGHPPLVPGGGTHRVGIVIALADEARALGLHPAYPPQVGTHSFASAQRNNLAPVECLHVTCGIGATAAAQAAQRLADAGASALLTVGYAGALARTLRSGDLVLADTLHTNDQQHDLSQPLHTSLIQALREHTVAVQSGGLLSALHVLGTVEQKQHAHRVTGAALVDMESAAVHRIATDRHLGFAALRVVLDDARTSIPQRVLACADTFGRTRLRALVALLLRHPSTLFSLRQLASQRALALASMRRLQSPLGTLSERYAATEAGR